jgi:hypothetical protein
VQLEDSMSGDDITLESSELITFSSQLEELMANLNTLKELDIKSFPEVQGGPVTHGSESQEEILAKLKEQLTDMNPEALATAAALVDTASSKERLITLQKVQNEIENFEYEKALDALIRIPGGNK